MISVKIDASEVHDLADDMRRTADELPARAQLVVEKAGYDTVAISQQLVRVDTGFLRGSIGVDFGALSFTAGPTADYGDIIERGVPHPFVINAKPGGTLHFTIDGREIFAKSVTHPPIPPSPYMAPAFDRELPQVEAALGQLGEQVFHVG